VVLTGPGRVKGLAGVLPVSPPPPFWPGAVAVTGVPVTGPAWAPAGMPVPVVLCPVPVAVVELPVIMVEPAAAVAPAPVRALRPGGFSPAVPD
jgi:hypothetical protein